MPLALPTLLVEMMQDGRWSHPGAEAIVRPVPFIKDELSFQTSPSQIVSGACLMETDEDENKILHEYRGSRFDQPRELPWIDVEKSVLLAINRFPGDDVAISLDYRTSTIDPRVIGSEWTDSGCFWREIAPAFTVFASELAESR